MKSGDCGLHQQPASRHQSWGLIYDVAHSPLCQLPAGQLNSREGQDRCRALPSYRHRRRGIMVLDRRKGVRGRHGARGRRVSTVPDRFLENMPAFPLSSSILSQKRQHTATVRPRHARGRSPQGETALSSRTDFSRTGPLDRCLRLFPTKNGSILRPGHARAWPISIANDSVLTPEHRYISTPS
jgi:hypothetical protein